MRRLKFAAVALAAVIALAGCGGGSDSTGSTSSHNTYSESKTYEGSGSTYGIANAMGSESDTMDEEYSGENGEASGDDGSILRKQEDQKIVYTGEMEIQTLDYDKSVADIKQKIREMGGFSEYEKENDYDYGWYDYEPDSYRKDKNRTLNITARIPSDNFETFMASVGETGKVMNKSVRAENISQVYAETETYKLALEKEQTRLLQMMDKAETIEEMIAVESRLSEVERQLSMYKTDHRNRRGCKIFRDEDGNIVRRKAFKCVYRIYCRVYPVLPGTYPYDCARIPVHHYYRYHYRYCSKKQ